MYQPQIKDELIRKLYFRARKEGKKMTVILNDMLEAYLIDEPAPPPYSKTMLRDSGKYRKEVTYE